MTLVSLEKSSEPPFPIKVEERAVIKMIQAKKDDPDLTENFNVRVACKGGGCSGMLYSLDFDDRSFDGDYKKDFTVGDDSITVVVDPHSAGYLKGTSVDYTKTAFSEGFKFIGGESVKRTCGCGESFSV